MKHEMKVSLSGNPNFRLPIVQMDTQSFPNPEVDPKEVEDEISKELIGEFGLPKPFNPSPEARCLEHLEQLWNRDVILF